MKKLLICVLILCSSVTAWAGKKDNDCLPLDVYMRSAKIYMGALGVIPDFPSAQKQLNKATECYPAEGEPRYMSAKIYYRKRMYAEFLSITKSLDTLEIGSVFRDTLWEMRRAAWGELFRRGVDSLKSSNELDVLRDDARSANDSTAYDSLTNERRRMRESAKTLFLAALEMDSTRSEPFQNMGVISIGLQSWEEALKWFRKALIVKPEEMDLIRNMMSLHLRLEHNDSAMHYTREILSREPEDLEALVNKASLHTALGDPDSANIVFHAIIEMDPENKPVLFNLGMTQVQQAQQYAKDIQRHLKTMQESAATYTKLAGKNTSAKELSRWEKKTADAGKSLKEAQTESEDSWSSASVLFERLAGLDSTDVEAQFYWGLSQFWMKNYEASLPPLGKAVSLNPNYCEAWNVLQYSYSKLGQKDKSDEAAAKAKDCIP